MISFMKKSQERIQCAHRSTEGQTGLGFQFARTPISRSTDMTYLPFFTSSGTEFLIEELAVVRTAIPFPSKGENQLQETQTKRED